MSQKHTEMATLRATTFKNSQHSFLEVLDQHDIKYNLHSVPVGVPMANGISVEIVITGGWGVLAIACLAWASVRKSRKINVTTKDKEVFWLEGYSADEAAKILAAAQQIAAIETKPENDET
jgi:hypothetical protein